MGTLATRTWRGVVQDLRSADMADEWANLVEPALVLNPMQGCYNAGVTASAQTHARAGALDLSVDGWTQDEINLVVSKGRQVGYKGSHRTVAQGFTADHIHAVALGSSDLSGMNNPLGQVMGTAAWQVAEILAGRNGLSGRGADDGDRTYIDQTWEQYLASRPAPPMKRNVNMLVITNGTGFALVTGNKVTALNSTDSVSALAGAGVPVVKLDQRDYDSVFSRLA